MTFADLTAGASVFVDANTLIHLFQPHPQFGSLSLQLAQRIDKQDLVGFTSSHVIILEAVKSGTIATSEVTA